MGAPTSRAAPAPDASTRQPHFKAEGRPRWSSQAGDDDILLESKTPKREQEETAAGETCDPRVEASSVLSATGTKDLEEGVPGTFSFDSKAVEAVVWVEWNANDPENPFNVRTIASGRAAGPKKLTFVAVESTQKMADLPALLRFYNRKHDPFTRTRFGADLQGAERCILEHSLCERHTINDATTRLFEGTGNTRTRAVRLLLISLVHVG
jgi:hypothetical protein